MPYWIAENFGDCNGWAVIDAAGEVFGCHQTKKDAINQAVAISLSTDEPFEGERANGEIIGNNGVMGIRAVAAELEAGVWVRWISDDEVEYGAVVAVDGDMVQVRQWDEEDGVWSETEEVVLVDVARVEVVEALPAPEVEHEPDMMRSATKFETRVQATDFEVRETPDGMVFEGYASVFNSRSENLGGFTEFVAPGAFTRSLKSRNDVKLLWNHDAGQVLGSTRAKTMTLTEDNRGLKVSATLPNTQLGRDTAELIRTGIIDSMSFGFNVIKDSWNSEGTERTLNAVRLFEVSIVAFPAYAGTAGTTSVRSLEKLATRAEVDMAELEAALVKLESGQDLDEASRDLLNTVINKVSPSATFDPEPADSVVGDLGLLALKKKKLELFEM